MGDPMFHILKECAVIWITILLALLTAAMAVWGVYMTSLFEKRRNALPAWHRHAVIGWVVAMGILIVVQATITDRDLRERDKKLDDMRLSLNGQLENLKGQLSTVSQLAANTLNPSAAIPKQLSKEIPKTIADLSDSELRENVIKFANNTRDFETNFKKEEYQRVSTRFLPPRPSQGTEEEMKKWQEEANKQWQAQTNVMLQRDTEYGNEFRKRFLGEAVGYRDELIKRLNIIPPEEEKRVIALQEFLAGVSPVSDLSLYLERLARQLP